MLVDAVTSTNSMAFDTWTAGPVSDLPEREALDGLVVLAEYQSEGRGRQGRKWASPRGASVLCSVLLLESREEDLFASTFEKVPARASADTALASHPDAAGPPSFEGWLTLVSAVAACEAIRETTDVTPAIKWPNDLRIRGSKLGGILIESRQGSAAQGAGKPARARVIGIGINCLQQPGHFTADLQGTATSLEMESSQAIDRATVARALLRRLDQWLAANIRPGDQAARDAWLQHAEPIGQRVRLRCGRREYAGRTVAVDPFGGLIIQNDTGQREWFDPMRTTLL
jgi:BirA family biotin operon repressor/biotin-[acetyl-CoA-carboxylase] ligase